MVEDRVVIVTGSGRGIGKAVAQRLATEGAKVVINDLGVSLEGEHPDSATARETAEEINAAGGRAIANGADISEHGQARDLIQAAIDTYGRLDVLINVAGILRPKMIFNMAENDWDDVIRVHLKGTFNTCKFAAAYWRDVRHENAHHRIINFTSTAGIYGSPGQPNYSAAKMGIIGLTYSCANALGKYGVTANALSPSAETRMSESVPPDRKLYGARSAATAENVAPAVVYLASERSDWLTGRIIGATGYQVTLLANPAPLVQLSSPVPWELEQLAEAMETGFKGDPRLRR